MVRTDAADGVYVREFVTSGFTVAYYGTNVV